MTLEEAIKQLEYGIEQMTMELKSGLWETGSDTEAEVKQGVKYNQQLIDWLTELKEAKRLLKHGYWIEEEPRVLKCSVCGEYAPMNYLGQNCIDSRYCPWCGTKMDSNADEPWQSE